jgi:uncharacterized protein (TIGR02145 family)
MRTQLTIVRAYCIRHLLAATLGIAITFTLSCHDGGNDDTGTSSPGGIGGSSPSDNSSSSVGGTGGSSPSGGSSSSANTFVGDKGTFKDNRDEQTYNWVKIGTQIWMAENLNYKAPGSKCYDNLAVNCEAYGRLYNWIMANHCPDGWHLPSNEEWNTLTNYIGADPGKKLKAATGWGDYNGTDDYGFVAIPGGYNDGGFGGMGTSTVWWGDDYSHRGLDNGNGVGGWGTYRDGGDYLSVRCLKGSPTRPVVERGSLVDKRDNNTYKTVKIGAQTWMAENLKYKATDNKCYDNLAVNCETYGRLYNWATATNAEESNRNPSGVQGVCPDGWHIPSDGEWSTLTNYIGDESGRKLKAKDGWNDYNNGTDDYSFRALPGGYVSHDGSFDGMGTSTAWWGTNSHRTLGSGNGVGGWGTYRDGGDYLSVRCIEDIEMP